MSRTSIKFLQANIQHAKAASAVLCRRVLAENIEIAMIQEPYVRCGRICGINLTRSKITYCRSCERPRAALLISNNVDFLPLPQFINQDMVAVLINIQLSGEKQIFVLCSTYCAGDKEIPSYEMQQLVDFCKQERYQLLLGCDSNAHNLIWGSKDTNYRGECFYEFIQGSGLCMLNQGSEPTFSTCIRSEVLDITLATYSISAKISNWHVSSEPSCSDHKHIRFDLDSAKTQKIQFRNPRDTDWSGYNQTLAVKLDEIKYNCNSVGDLEITVNQFRDAIVRSYHENCPLKEIKDNRNSSWWNKKLENMRKEVRRLARRSKVTGDWSEHRINLTQYNKQIRKAKRENWRKFCESIEDMPATHRIHKVFSKDSDNMLGMLRHSDGSLTKSSREVLDLLRLTHFPGSIEVTDSNFDFAHQGNEPRSENWHVARSVVTRERVNWAINSLAPYKTPGEDGIVPVLLQKALDILEAHLVQIFRLCLVWEYVPSSWNIVRIVYIPKVGRVREAKPNSYRPISLTSFLLKTLEKLMDRYIREKVLVLRPLHKFQYAYQPGKSTETALDALVRLLEIGLEQKEIAVAIFLDIEGAFNNASSLSMINSLANRGVELCISNWIKTMLDGRIVKTTLFQDELIARTTRGCPQGGVLSPLLWALVVDELLDLLTKAGFEVQGYADDLVIVIRGKYGAVISDRVQLALDMVTSWCFKEGLSVNPLKTAIVPFTRRINIKDLRNPTLGGVTIQFKSEIKYLGVILDKRLTWNSHLKRIKEKANFSWWQCSKLCGRNWGLRPKMLYYLYTTVVRPALSYACQVWWPKVKQAGARLELQRIQRLPCISITGAFRTTPTVALERLLNLPPLDIFIEGEARNSSYRLLWIGNNYTNNWFENGHSRILHDLKRDDFLGMPSDLMIPKFNFDIPFSTKIPSLEEWMNPNQHFLNGDVVWFTDGSKNVNGLGAGIFCENPRKEIFVSLGRFSTVFQAEIFAIELCARECLETGYSGKKILICSDSQAAIKALVSYRVSSKLVWNCLETLICLGRNNQVLILWIPGHKGFEGNEMADSLAKKGASEKFMGPEPVVAVALNTAKTVNGNWVNERMILRWSETEGLAHSKKFILGTSKTKTNQLLQLNRQQLRIIIGLYTGHCGLKEHLFKVRLVEERSCRFCTVSLETAEHILCSCEALERKRFIHLGKGRITPMDVWSLETSRILDYINGLNLSSAF